ncbi:MAG: hypothetical protein AB1758_10420 [Candidatus Eremiobacterota bacterium]
MIGWGQTRRLEVRYTGELRGQVDALPRLATLVQEERRQHPDLVLVDCGNFSRGTPLAEEFHGQPLAEVFAHLGYAAVLPGEMERAWGLTVLRELAAWCPFVAADWVGVGGCWASSRRLESNGLQVVVAGLAGTAPEGVRTLEPEAALTPVLQDLAPHEVGILLSRLGWRRNRELALRFDQFQVILDGPASPAEAVRVHHSLLVPGGLGPASVGSLGLDLTGSLVIGGES